MALFKIHKGDTANLDAQSRVEGYCWFTPDTGHFFIDTADARVPINATMYGVCNTAAATATKTVDITGFRLYTGARVTVKFTYASGASNSTLNVNGTGAKNMVRYGTTAIGNSSTLGWAAGAIQTFTYDGTSWVADYWQNTTYSNVALGQGYATCSTAAATAAKTASLSSYSLTKGGIVAVKFTYAVPANATLNINSKGAKNIYYRGAKIVAGIIDAGDTAIFMYDGTQYQFLAKDYNSATTTTAGLMSAADKAKLDGIAAGANNYTYTLPNATSSTLGGVKIGSNITVSSGTISLTKDNVTAALGYTPPTTNTTYTVATQSANGLMSKDDKFKLDNTNVAYGTCATAAETAAKAVTLSGNTQWKLTNGAIIMVKFTNTNSASAVTLNVNSTGAYPIWYSNAEYTGAGTAYTGYAGRTVTYMFNGTHWVWVSGSYDANTQSNTNSTNTSSKIYLVGATSQGSNKTTYSHDTVYVGTDGHLYSNSKQAVNLSDTQALTNKTYNGYTLAAACAKGVATSVASGNTNLVTSGAVYTAIQNSVTSVNGQTGAVTLKFIYGNANYTLRLNDNATDRTGALAVKDANDKNVWILLNTTTAGVLQYQWYDSNGSWVNQANLLHTKNYTDYCAKASHTHNYLPLAGGTVTGEVTSSANVTASNAAFRNIKAVPSTTEIVAGTTAIPTGEIWVRYE